MIIRILQTIQNSLKLFLGGYLNLSLLVSILMVLYMAVPTDATVWETVSAVGGTFLVGNIPTVIYLLIYFACRETQKRRRLLEKMNIQDLDG